MSDFGEGEGDGGGDTVAFIFDKSNLEGALYVLKTTGNFLRPENKVFPVCCEYLLGSLRRGRAMWLPCYLSWIIYSLQC